MVVADVCEEESVVAEDGGVVGVGFEGSLEEFLGAIIILANVCEEESVVAEDAGVVGVDGEGLCVEFLSLVVTC